MNALVVAPGLPATRIHAIVKERRAVTADAAAPWLAMQANDDLESLPTMGEFQRQVPSRQPLAA